MVFNLVVAVLGVVSIGAVVTGFEEGGVTGGTSIAFGLLLFLGILWVVRPGHHSVLPLFGIMVVGAIIIPIIVFFARDKDTILNIERESVQTAMYSMMVDRDLITVGEHTTGPAVNTWNAFPISPGAVLLSDYMRAKTTKYYFCWDAHGKTWPRNDPGKDPTRKALKKPGNVALCHKAKCRSTIV